MGKTMKIALAVLYALQVVVIFRESLTHLTSRGGEEQPGGQKQNFSRSPEFSDPRAFFKRAFQPLFKRHGSLVAAPAAAAAAVLTEIKKEESHLHPPETKKDVLVRKIKMRRLNRYLLANLFPSIKKIRPPDGPNTANSPIAIRRATMFVSAS